MDVITFKEALNMASGYKIKHLLLGNGFSIACDNSIFTYNSLYNETDFSDSPEIKKSFDLLGTTDFEYVIEVLEKSSIILPAYLDDKHNIASKMVNDSKKIKDLLIETISTRHPSMPSIISGEKYSHCRSFLLNFIHKDNGGKVYTLNYDLLLYWTLMSELDNENSESKFSDGFGRDTVFENGEVYFSDDLTWQHSHDQNIHFLHGALHIYDAGYELQKYSWIDTGKPLISQAREALNNNKFPLFVTEGDSLKKMEKIVHNAYLYNSYKSFEGICEGGLRKEPASTCLFTYGVSFSQNDSHILNLIPRGRIKHLFIGIYGDPYSEKNQEIIAKVEAMKSQRDKYPLQVTYYSAESANVWG